MKQDREMYKFKIDFITSFSFTFRSNYYLGPFKILPEGLCIAALKTSSGSKLKA